MITGKNYIGNTLSATGKITFKTINPKTNVENETVFYEATPEEVNESVTIASSAFENYKHTNDTDKAVFLETIAEELETLKKELITIYMKELGLPDGRANGEFERAKGQLRAFAEMLKKGSWVEVVIDQSEGKPDLRRMLIPLGPVAVSE